MKGRRRQKWPVILLFIGFCGIFYFRAGPKERPAEFFGTSGPDAVPGSVMSIFPDENEEKSMSGSVLGTGSGMAAGLQELPGTATEGNEAQLLVHVCGEVRREGVYSLPPEARVVDAIEAAGGLTAEAAGAYLNQAAPVADGMRIYIPSLEEVEQAGGGVPGDSGGAEPGGVPGDSGGAEPGGIPGDSGGKVNLNTADMAALTALSGIGESKARAIVQYRDEHGPFQRIEDLMQIPGIKEGTFEKIKDKITVE